MNGAAEVFESHRLRLFGSRTECSGRVPTPRISCRMPTCAGTNPLRRTSSHRLPFWLPSPRAFASTAFGT